MTSKSGSTSSADRMQLMLQQMVSAGSVKSADQSALSGALDDIKTAMTSGSQTPATSPTDMKSKVDSLVDQEVTDGKLTSDQATELKNVFAQAAQKMGGHHHHHAAPPSDDSTSTDDSSTSAISATGATSSSSSTDSLTTSIETLISFLKKMETAASSATNYNASGTNASSSTQSLLVNLTA